MTAGAEQVREPVLSVNFATWTINGQRMSRSDHALLQVFIERAGTVVTKRELWLAFWGSVPQNDYGRLTSRAVDAAVSRLRRKGVPLVNIWGVGWLLPEDPLDATSMLHAPVAQPSNARAVALEPENKLANYPGADRGQPHVGRPRQFRTLPHCPEMLLRGRRILRRRGSSVVPGRRGKRLP